MGSMREARRAGTYAANSAVASRIATAAPSATLSRGLTPYRKDATYCEPRALHVAERRHGIDAGSAARWHARREPRRRQQNRDRRPEGHRIARLDAVQEGRHILRTSSSTRGGVPPWDQREARRAGTYAANSAVASRIAIAAPSATG